jgi:hypothetical protein
VDSPTRGVSPPPSCRWCKVIAVYSPHLQGIVAGSPSDADLEQVATGGVDAERTLRGEDGPGVAGGIAGDGTLGIADEQIEIVDVAIAGGVDAIAPAGAGDVERVVVGRIVGALVLKSDGSQGMHSA